MRLVILIRIVFIVFRQSSTLLHSNLTKKLLVIFILSSSYAFSQQNTFREFSQELSQPYVYSINQDANGYLWIGTGNGLTKFDGTNFKTYSVNDSLADNFITCSFINKTEIWFGHMNGMFSTYDGKKFSSPDVLSQKSGITDIEQTSTGEIWASTFSNAFVKLDKYATVKHKSPVDQLPIYTFKFLRNNELLLGSVNGLFYGELQSSGKLTNKRKIAGIPETKISDIITMRNDSGYFIATENDGIYQLILKGKEFKVFQVGEGTGIDFNSIQSIQEDRKFNLWISTFGNGIIKLNYPASKTNIHPVFYNKSTGFLTNDVKTIFEDREGNIWSGNFGTGLTQITENAYELNRFNDSKYGSAIFSICISNNIKWLGTNKGLLKINSSTAEILKFYSNKHGFPKDNVTSLFSNNKNELWIGTETNGLYRFFIDKEKFISYKYENGILENSITTITGKNSEIWVGTKKGVLKIDLLKNQTHWYTHGQKGLPHNFVTHLLIDSKNKVWVTTLSNTLAIIENGKVLKKMIVSEQRIFSLGPIVEENESTFWVGSQGSGIFRINSDSIVNLTSNDGLISNYCYSLLLDSNKNIWVGHRGGISKIRIADFYIKPLQQYSGIKSSFEFNPNAVFKDEKNRILFGTNEGLWTYDPDLEKKSDLLPPVLNITSVKINDKEFGYKSNLNLRPGKYKIEISFVGINFKEPSLVNYKYELEGYDLSPETTNSRSVVYQHLNEGEYTFNLWANSGDGVMTKQPVSIHIIIKTAFWKHWWFYIIIALVIFLGIIINNKNRELKHASEKRYLEEKVRERTLELAEKNDLLQEKQEEIISQNHELEKYQNYLEDLVNERTIELLKAKNKAEESDRLKTAILNNMSHEIRTPMNAICGFSNLLEDDSLTKEEKSEYIRLINTNTESLLFLINGILDMSMIEANKITLTNVKIDIDEFLHDLENKYKATKKNVNLEYLNEYKNNKLFVYGDVNRLHQVFTNLLNNAFKFTEYGSIKFGYETIDKHTRFFVSDTGIGIDKLEIDKIFEKFHKIENNQKKLYRGAGIGLATSKNLVELMGGEIWVESEINKGSTFYFSLPIISDISE